jgi:UDP-glucose 4-epimerase
LVTGGAGFIGSHLVEALAAGGAEVRVLDDLSSGRLDNLSAAEGRVELIVGSILDTPLVERLAKGAAAVFHLAAMASVPQTSSDPESCLAVNGGGCLSVMRAAAAAGVKRLVYASSSAIYGDLPAPHGELMAPRPNTPYAAIKLLGEHMGLFYRQSSPLVTVSLRYFNVYGPRQSAGGPDAGVVPVFAKALAEGRPPVIYGDGSQTRDFVHVSDVVRANILAAAAAFVDDGVFNVATGLECSVSDVWRLLSEGSPGAPEPVHAPPRAGDAPRSAGLTAKAASVLGFAAAVPLAEGLAELRGAAHGPRPGGAAPGEGSGCPGPRKNNGKKSQNR